MFPAKDEDGVKAGIVVTVGGEGADFGEEAGGDLVGEETSAAPEFRSSNENADEDPEVKVFVKNEGSIRKKIREAMLAKGKLIMLEKVKLYVQNMMKSDLEVKRVEPKSNQSAPPAAAIKTAPTASKPAVVVEKKSKDLEAIDNNKG
ncbi:uncharacterized protein LOC111435904 [Cucurbita moschata]|uniref:Uncharacterized protein LOC111435904 n=1 Tax=Cucurbita moschata TaxID=3662 RepID=A0A6J1ERL2_CUCMO|nr:uncharacterized protein LOC111435904 [Cucurbita moschata]